jgi:hypothetical protein
MPTDAEIAWFAGIFEGEGTFETSKRSTVRMTIAMSDLDVIERLALVFPCREIATRQSNKRFPDAKPMHAWRVGDSDQVAAVIEAILPWLGERRSARAREVLAHIENRQVPGDPRNSHCKQGHALTPDNLVRRGGVKPHVRCKTCAREQWRAYNRKRATAAN